MSEFPFFTRGLAGIERKSLKAEEVPTHVGRPARTRYRFSPELSYAVNVALLLGQPLLVTGAPGVGKTELAGAVAEEIGAPLHRFETQSISEARDLFYSYDAISAFRSGDKTDLRAFVEYRALGRALIEAFPRDKVEHMLAPGARHDGPRRAVVLIDEIDKAPRDFPNDLLNQIARQVFRVPELDVETPTDGEGVSLVGPAHRPIVVVTSNSEKTLPDAFLRRCVYHHIPFPNPKAMREIVTAHFPDLDLGSELVRTAVELFYALRESQVGLAKPPSTSELLAWLLTLLRHPDVSLQDPVHRRKKAVLETLGVLIKKERDRERAEAFIEGWRAAPAEDA